jgi:hypothetical protein
LNSVNLIGKGFPLPTHKKEGKVMKKFIEFIVFILTGKGALSEEMVNLGLLDFSGEGRNKYGK